MQKFSFTAFYKGQWTKMVGIYMEDYLESTEGSFEFSKCIGVKLISQTISSELPED